MEKGMWMPIKPFLPGALFVPNWTKKRIAFQYEEFWVYAEDHRRQHHTVH